MVGESTRASSGCENRIAAALPWYEAAFGEHYLDVYRHRDDRAAAAEVAFIVGALDLPTGAPVLDLCCGAGRHSDQLEKAGLGVYGLDLSEPLVRQARSRGLPVVRGDMRALPFAPASFQAVVNLFTSFGYFEDDSENAAVLGQISRVLRPGGKLLIDHIHAPSLTGGLVAESRREQDGRTIIERRNLDRTRRRVEKTVSVHGAGLEEPIEYVESVRFYDVEELEAMLSSAGLTSTARYGSLEGRPYDADAKRMVLLAEKS